MCSRRSSVEVSASQWLSARLSVVSGPGGVRWSGGGEWSDVLTFRGQIKNSDMPSFYGYEIDF